MDRTDIQRQPEKIIRAGLLHARQHRKDTGDTNCMLVRLARFWTWLQYRQCFIRDTHEKIIPLVPNRAQCMLFAIMLLQAMVDRPIRIVVLKARKVGVTTFVEAWFYFNCRFYRNQKAVMLAHLAESTDEIFEITKTVGLYDQFRRPRATARLLTFRTRSTYMCHTAGSENVGAGGTPNMLHRSELALWKTGIKRQSDTTSGRAVPMTPTSCIIDESTARGHELFYDRFVRSASAEHPFEPLFIPWFLDDRLRGIAPSHGLQLTADETALMRRAKQWDIEVPVEALVWRRATIAEIGLAQFKQEHPSTPEEAIETQRGLVLPSLRACVVTELPFEYSKSDVQDRVGGWDAGYAHPFAILAGVVWDGALYVVAAHAQRGALADEQAGHVQHHHTYYCDPAGLSDRKELEKECRQRGIPAEFVPAPHLTPGPDRVKQEWQLVRTWAEQGKLFILDTCADLILMEADNLLWNETTGEPDMAPCPAGTDAAYDWGHYDRIVSLRYMTVGCKMRDRVVQRVGRPARRPSRRDMVKRW